LKLEGIEPVEEIEKGKIVILLFGKILKGGFSLVKMKRRGERNWLLIKEKDRYSRVDWTLQMALTEEKKKTLAERTPPCAIEENED
jgi:bifunctional non-homologous end joining protein LigD